MMSKHFSNNHPGLSRAVARQITREKIWASLPNKLLEREVMTSPPSSTFTTALTLSSPVWWAPCSAAGTGVTAALGGEFFSFIKGGLLSPTGTSSPHYNFVRYNCVTQSATPTYGSSILAVKFVHEGQKIEIAVKTTSSRYRVKVDGKYISLTDFVSADSSVRYIYLDFGSRAQREIEILSYAGHFGGVYTEANDTVTAAKIKGPRVIILGDSFTSGSGATSNSNMDAWTTWFGEAIGWDDVWPSGVSSTGYLANGTTKNTFRERVAHDVIPFSPDIIMVMGGINDSTYSQSQIYNEAKALFSELKAGCPNALLIVGSPFAAGGVSEIISAAWGVRDGIKTAAKEAGAIYLDFLEGDLPGYIIPATGTLAASTATGAAAFTSTAIFPVKGTIKIGTDRAEILSVSGTTTYTYTIDGTLSTAHSAGDAISQVGGSFWKGTGRVGATAGYGNCDLLVSTDNLHPSDAGHASLGRYIASMTLMNILKAL